MQTMIWLRLLAYAERDTFVRQRARDRREALLLNGGVIPALQLAPLTLTEEAPAGSAIPPRRRRRS